MTLPAPQSRHRNRLLGFIAMILGVAAMRASYPVTMPVLFAAVIIAAIWPMKPRLDQWLPSRLSYVVTIFVLVALLTGFAAAVYFSVGQVIRVLIAHWPEAEVGYNKLVAWASRWGVPIEGPADKRRIFGFLGMLASEAYTFAVYLGFVGLLVILGLLEVPLFHRKLQTELSGRARHDVMHVVQDISVKVRLYLSTTLVTSVLTGVASAACAFATGLDLALVWGLLNFLLNFVPVIGNIVGIIPPVLYAFIQFHGYVMPLFIFAAFAIVQIVISNFVYPILQGSRLALSPLAIVVAMAFWTWVWGIAGALVAVPLTAALAIVCAQFERTKWFAALLSAGEGDATE